MRKKYKTLVQQIYRMEIIKNWFSKKKKYVGFEDVKYAISQRKNYIIINTLSAMNQECLIHGTLPSSAEESVINNLLDQYDDKRAAESIIILYGKHSADDSVHTKSDQLQTLGFSNIYIYGGGLFEWLLLQDIYGQSEFPTTAKCKDILKYRADISMPRFSMRALTYS